LNNEIHVDGLEDLFDMFLSWYKLLKKGSINNLEKAVVIEDDFLKESLIFLKNLILDGYSDDIFNFHLDLIVCKLLLNANENQISRIILVKHMFPILRSGNSESFYHILSKIGGWKLRNKLIPNSIEFLNT